MRTLALTLIGCLWVTAVGAAEITVFSAGAVEPGLLSLLDGFRRETGHMARLTVAVPAVLQQRVEGGETPDVIIAPTPVIGGLVQAGGVPLPDISSPERITQALLSAESLVYTTGCPRGPTSSACWRACAWPSR